MSAISFLLFGLIVTIVIGFVTYNNRTGILRLLPWFQLAMLILELFAHRRATAGKETMSIYDWVTVLELGYFGSIFFIYARTKINKILCLSLIFLFVLSEILFYSKVSWVRFAEYNFLSFYLSSYFLITMSLAYLIEKLRSDDIMSFNQNPIFWIAIGLLLYYCCNSYFIITNYMGLTFEHHTVVHAVITYISVLSLYSCLTVAMFCKRYVK